MKSKLATDSPLFGDGQCARGALQNLGATKAQAVKALTAYGYTGTGATITQTILAADDLFGKHKDILAGTRVVGLTARETANWAGTWLIFVEGHVMAGGNDLLLNQNGYGNEQVIVAVRVG